MKTLLGIFVLIFACITAFKFGYLFVEWYPKFSALLGLFLLTLALARVGVWIITSDD